MSNTCRLFFLAYMLSIMPRSSIQSNPFTERLNRFSAGLSRLVTSVGSFPLIAISTLYKRLYHNSAMQHQENYSDLLRSIDRANRKIAEPLDTMTNRIAEEILIQDAYKNYCQKFEYAPKEIGKTNHPLLDIALCAKTELAELDTNTTTAKHTFLNQILSLIDAFKEKHKSICPPTTVHSTEAVPQNDAYHIPATIPENQALLVPIEDDFAREELNNNANFEEDNNNNNTIELEEGEFEDIMNDIDNHPDNNVMRNITTPHELLQYYSNLHTSWLNDPMANR